LPRIWDTRACFGIDKQAALSGLYYNAAASMVTNCVKLVPLGQVQGQQLLFSLQDLLVDLVNKSMVPDRGLVGLCCAGFDIRCMQHERLYSRVVYVVIILYSDLKNSISTQNYG
jgi:urease accessory protein